MAGRGGQGSGGDVARRLPVGASALVALLLFWLTTTPAAQQLSTRQLGFHHVLHWTQFVAGLVIAANWRRRSFRGHPGLAAAAVSAALAYVLIVHLPWPLDEVISSELPHAALHAGLFAAGALVGIAWRDVTELTRVLIAMVTAGLMTILSLAEISGAFSYSAYPAGQEVAAGIVMLVGMGLLWVALAVAGLPARLSRRQHPAVSVTCALVMGALIVVSYRVP